MFWALRVEGFWALRVEGSQGWKKKSFRARGQKGRTYKKSRRSALGEAVVQGLRVSALRVWSELILKSYEALGPQP